MDEHKALDYALAVMKNLNLIIILYMGILIFNCLRGYVQGGCKKSCVCEK